MNCDCPRATGIVHYENCPLHDPHSCAICECEGHGNERVTLAPCGHLPRHLKYEKGTKTINCDLCVKRDKRTRAEVLAPIKTLVDKQAEDEGLWYRAQTSAEAYVQQELRRLHAVIERQGEEEKGNG